MIATQLNDLIALFISKVYEAESLMKQYMGIKYPFEWRQNGIPQTGEFLDGYYKYFFHKSK